MMVDQHNLLLSIAFLQTQLVPHIADIQFPEKKYLTKLTKWARDTSVKSLVFLFFANPLKTFITKIHLWKGAAESLKINAIWQTQAKPGASLQTQNVEEVYFVLEIMPPKKVKILLLRPQYFLSLCDSLVLVATLVNWL